MLLEEGCGDASRWAEPARWASGLEKSVRRLLHLGQTEYHLSTSNKGGGAVNALLVYDPCRTCKDGVTIAIDKLGGGAGCGKTTKLFWTDRDPVKRFQALETGAAGFTFAIISSAKAEQAGADQAAGWICSAECHG